MPSFSDLTLKAQAFVFTILIGMFSVNAISQEAATVEMPTGETIQIEASELEKAAADLDAESEKHTGKVKKSIQKISMGFKNLVKDLKAKAKNKKESPKKKLTFKRVLLKAGKGATFLSINMSRPFINAAGFVKGFVERPSKNAQDLAFMQLFLNHEEEFSDVWKDIDHIYNVDQAKAREAFASRVDTIIENKKETITKDLYAHFANNPADISKEGITAFVNAHPEFQELRPIVGDLDITCAECMEDMDLFADPLQLLNSMRITIAEGVASFGVKTILPKMVLGIVSKSLGGAVLAVSLVADAGMITSALMCTVNKKVVRKIIEEDDEELKEFCQYVVNKSAYQISVSRVKGYVSGKNIRRKFIKKKEQIKRKLKRNNKA